MGNFFSQSFSRCLPRSGKEPVPKQLFQRSGAQGNGRVGSGLVTSSEVYIHLDDRRYHQAEMVPDPMPVDQTEMDRLDQQHYMIRMLTNANYYAPVEEPRKVIDIATGTGIWMLEMAPEFPETSFLGTDIVRWQPETVLPGNCRFETFNICEGIPYPDSSFDYVHHRFLATAIPREQWVDFVTNCGRICESGGWVEMVESSCLLRNTGPLGGRANFWLQTVCSERKVDLLYVDRIPSLMQDTGIFHEVHTHHWQQPVGARGGAVGKQALANFVSIVLAMKPHILRLCPEVTDRTITKVLAGLEEELDEYETYWSFEANVGQKI